MKTGNRNTPGYIVGAGNRTLQDGAWTYDYDYEGNLNFKARIGTNETWDYLYDHENKLVSAEQKIGGVTQQLITYSYDAFSRRATRTVGSNIERYAYDGQDVVADLDGGYELTARRSFGSSVDELVARVTPGATAWYLTDYQGSIIALTDASGVSLGGITFDGYGNILADTTGSFGDRYKYTGREWEAVARLQYNRARYYDPDLGRWTSEDPKGFAAGDWNLSRYVGNGPTNGTDPTGEVFYVRSEAEANRWVESLSGKDHGYLKVTKQKQLLGDGYNIDFADVESAKRAYDRLDSISNEPLRDLYLAMLYSNVVAEGLPGGRVRTERKPPSDSWRPTMVSYRVVKRKTTFADLGSDPNWSGPGIVTVPGNMRLSQVVAAARNSAADQRALVEFARGVEAMTGRPFVADEWKGSPPWKIAAARQTFDELWSDPVYGGFYREWQFYMTMTTGLAESVAGITSMAALAPTGIGFAGASYLTWHGIDTMGTALVYKHSGAWYPTMTNRALKTVTGNQSAADVLEDFSVLAAGAMALDTPGTPRFTQSRTSIPASSLSRSAHTPVLGSEWYESFVARYGVENVQWSRLPTFDGGKSVGVLRTPHGEFDLVSGLHGPAGSLPKLPGLTLVPKTHVEAHAAAIMRILGDTEGVLFINNRPCQYIWRGRSMGCNVYLGQWVPEGGKLRVVAPRGYVRDFPDFEGDMP